MKGIGRVSGRPGMWEKASSGDLDYDLVDEHISTLPQERELIIPEGVEMSCILLQNDTLLDNGRVLQVLGIQDDDERIHTFTSSGHMPRNYEEVYECIGTLIQEGFSRGRAG